MIDLDRFVAAQAPIYAAALAELNAGRKRSHWMWFVFPQLAGLGNSDTARFYALRSAGEARAFLHHPLLGARLRECCDALLRHQERSAEDMLGVTDALKLRSSMTLFNLVAVGPEPFADVLSLFFAGLGDPLTLALLNQHDDQ